MAIISAVENARARILSSDSMHSIIDEMFSANIEEYAQNPENFLAVIKECILPFTKTCKSLNASKGKASHGELVRLRCMIHDSKGFEMFVTSSIKLTETGRQVSCGLLKDSFQYENEDKHDFSTASRHNYVVMPVPGATEWYNNVSCAQTGDSSNEPQGLDKQDECFKILAKFFDESCSELKPNHVFDLVGIMDTTDIFVDDLAENSKLLHNRLHVIAYEAVEDCSIVSRLLPQISTNHANAISLIRKSFVSLFGDENAAEFLLCHLVSTTYSRLPGNSICSMPINLINVTDTSSVIRHIKLLMPKVKVLEINEKNLFEKLLTTRMNYETEILEEGPLQLSNGTILIIDETKFCWQSVAGLLQEKRDIMARNLNALRTLVKEQIFDYDYVHYPITLECDVQVLVLSKGKSRLNLELPFTVAIPPQFSDGVDPAAVFQSDSILNECRHAIQTCRSNVSSVTIPDAVTKEVTDLFVRTRSSGTDSVAATDLLNRLLTFSRLLTVLDGKNEVDISLWNKAQDLEKERTSILTEVLKTVA